MAVISVGWPSSRWGGCEVGGVAVRSVGRRKVGGVAVRSVGWQ